MTTIDEKVMKELESGPKTLTHLQRKCAPPARWPDTRPKDISGILALMVSEGSIDVQEWVPEKGKFVPVYRRRRRCSQSSSRARCAEARRSSGGTS